VGGSAVARPAFRSDRKRLLGGLLGQVKIAEKADQKGDNATPLFAEDPLEQG
jgi:hypothetical protein